MSGSLRELLGWTFLLLAPMALTIGITAFCMVAPARRSDRARLFLDLLQTAIETGQSPERVIHAISETREKMVSVHFHLLAAHIEEGANLDQALARAKRLLPADVTELIRIGATQSALPRLLPAARAMLNDTTSRMRGALNYVVVFLLVIAPAAILFLPILSIFVWPKLRAIMEELEVPLPALTTIVFGNFGFATAAELVLAGAILFFAFFYVGGPNVRGWLRIFGAWPDRALLCLPWRRHRAQRDFTGTLAVLLDAGVDEARAVELAGRASVNVVFQRRAQRVADRLRQGVGLPEALKAIETGGEFAWRWESALRSGKSFYAALRGWHESLEARAFQQEQAAAHLITTGIVLLNGVLVTLLTSAVLLILIAIIEEGTLW